jgi:hypothetical protein
VQLILWCLLVVILTIVGAPAVFAQGSGDGGPDPASVRVKLGPLWMNPSIALTNLGVDTNVFNDPEGVVPKRDFTFTVTPQTDVWLRMGRTWVTGTVREDIVWYQTYASQRSNNNSYTAGWKIPLTRVSFSVNGNWTNTHDRPGYEIDARAGRTDTAYSGSAELRAMSKTFIGVSGSWSHESFDQGAVFLGTNLHDELNRTSTTGSLSLRHQLTPLTTISLTGSRTQDRFDLDPLRDANSTSFAGTVAFDPAALIKGSVTFGYRNFQPQSPDLPTYVGTAALVNLSYAIFGTTKFGLSASRDVQYSYDVNQPYYISTGIGGSVAQQVFGPLDVVARIGAQQLAYRDRVGAVVAVPGRVDRVQTFGGGIGYHFGKDTRLGLNIDRSTRASGVASREYRGWRYGTAITYGT